MRRAIVAGSVLLAAVVVGPVGSAEGHDVPKGAWTRLAECESGNRWHINTGNGYYGGLQISGPTWRGYGGLRFAALPHQASRRQQIVVAHRIRHGQGWGAWPVCSRRAGLR